MNSDNNNSIKSRGAATNSNDEKHVKCLAVALAFDEHHYNEHGNDSKLTSWLTSNHDSDFTANKGDGSTITDYSNQVKQEKCMVDTRALTENQLSMSRPVEEAARTDGTSLIPPRDSNILLSSTHHMLDPSVSRSNNSSDDQNRVLRQESKHSSQRSIDNSASTPVGAIAVAGNRSRSSTWDDDSSISDANDYESDDGITRAVRGWDGVHSQSSDSYPNLPMAQMVTPASSIEIDPIEVREQFAKEMREAIAAEVQHAKPVTTTPPSKGRHRCSTMVLCGLVLPLALVVVGVVLLVGRRRSTTQPMPSAKYPTTLEMSASTYSPSNSPIVLLPDGRKAFTTTTQLRTAVDEYCLMLKSSNKPELSEIATEYGFPIGAWDVSRLTDFSRIFDPQRSQRLEVSRSPSVTSSFDEDLSGWDMSNAVNLQGMFAGANSFTGKGLEQWDVSKVADFSFLFAKASRFNGNLSTWNTSSAVRMDAMFSDAVVFNGDITRWDMTRVSSVTYMFHYAKAFRGGDLRKWDVANVTDMRYMFALSDFNGKVSTWDTSKVTNMEHMFACTSIDDDLSSWSVEKVQFMRTMFFEADLFTGGNLNEWNTSSVTDMSKMFYKAAAFQGNISLWDVANVEYFEETFSYATLFDGDLSRWQTTSALSMSSMFYHAESFSGVNISLWDTRKVTSMNSMFGYAFNFNSDLSAWDVSSLADASFMFLHASAFDQNLCSWGELLTGSVEVAGMFSNTSCPNTSDPSTSVGALGPFCYACVDP